ncbi:hypothetical protein Y032_0387g457 [Ancylostoma ceylanicum]|uniref:Uncharacterized protein n=1 Tax=Ancylostoma ceylanicum TaxID=53326 RepID=A0A016RSK4_9BILA|nr:hypothetical protein Y032_0387g457 [Ancylostoma ceylanicum]
MLPYKGWSVQVLSSFYGDILILSIEDKCQHQLRMRQHLQQHNSYHRPMPLQPQLHLLPLLEKVPQKA